MIPQKTTEVTEVEEIAELKIFYIVDNQYFAHLLSHYSGDFRFQKGHKMYQLTALKGQKWHQKSAFLMFLPAFDAQTCF